MAASSTPSCTKSSSNIEIDNKVEDEEYEKLSQECNELLLSLPREKGWDFPYLYLYQDIWYPPPRIQALISFQKHFQARESDIIIATLPKSGTTWLKALTFAIINRAHLSPSQPNHPLLSSNSHDLVPFLEFNYYGNNQIPDLQLA